MLTSIAAAAPSATIREVIIILVFYVAQLAHFGRP